MSMDDPGWGEAVPDAEPPAPRSPSSPSSSGSGRGGLPANRNVLIGGGVAVLAAIVVVIVLVSGGGKHNAASKSTTTPATTAPAATTPPTTSAPTTAAPTTVDPTAAAGATYISLETPAYDSLTAFGAKISTWQKSPPSAVAAQAAANPTVLAFKKFSAQLLAHTWPSSAQSKIDVLASQTEVVANDLGGLQLAFSNNTEKAWASQWETDAGTLVTDVNSVRSALKLPNLPTS